MENSILTKPTRYLPINWKGRFRRFLCEPVTVWVIVGTGVGERLDAVAGVCRGCPGRREAALPACYVVQLAGAPSSITITTYNYSQSSVFRGLQGCRHFIRLGKSLDFVQLGGTFGWFLWLFTSRGHWVQKRQRESICLDWVQTFGDAYKMPPSLSVTWCRRSGRLVYCKVWNI